MGSHFRESNYTIAQEESVSFPLIQWSIREPARYGFSHNLLAPFKDLFHSSLCIFFILLILLNF